MSRLPLPTETDGSAAGSLIAQQGLSLESTLGFLVTPQSGPRDTIIETSRRFLMAHSAQIAINAHFFTPCPDDGRDDVNVFDVIRVMDGSQNMFKRCDRHADGQRAGVPDGLDDIDDILATLDAFSGAAYPDADPCRAPGVRRK